jgi:hypothetical protein
MVVTARIWRTPMTDPAARARAGVALAAVRGRQQAVRLVAALAELAGPAGTGVDGGQAEG